MVASERVATFPGWSSALGAALDRLSLAVRRRARSPYAGAVRSVSRGRALEFAAHRPYTPGDDPRQIDWRAYSRLGRVYLKQFDEERARRVTLLLDASASMDFGGADTTRADEHKGNFARRLTAALAWIALGRGDSVRTLVLKSGRAESLPPVGSRAGIGTLFDALGSVREDGGPGLAPAVRAALGALAPGSAGPVLLVSDLLDPTWSEAVDALAAGARGLSGGTSAAGGAGSEAAVIQPLAPTEWSPTLGDEVELEDAETGELRPTRLDPAELAAYGERLDLFLTDVHARCARHDVTHAALDTGAALEKALLSRLTAAGILE